MAAVDVERVEWDTFLSDVFDWRQGEHVSLIGHTGSGKTTALLAILPHRRYCVLVGTKARDRTLSGLVRRPRWGRPLRPHEWRRIEDWPPPDPTAERVVLWPRLDRLEDTARQQDVFGRMLEGVFSTGGWCVAADELHYLATHLGLRPQLELLYEQGRSLGVSLVAATQRPAWVPLAVYSQATHLFLWRSTDDRDTKRLSDIGGGIDRDLIRRTTRFLPRFDCLYVNTRDDVAVVTRAPAPKGR